MNVDDNGNSYADMQAVPFSRSDVQVQSAHEIVNDGYAQLPVLMSDDDGKEFMVHFADDHDVENIEDDLELGVGNDSLKITFQQGNGDDDTRDSRSTNPIPDQERFLPIANVARVMKRMIPSSGKIAKDAKECVQECVSEFISFITSEANDKCLNEKRKTISADDLLDAITNMGFDNYVAPLQLFLERYRAAHKLNAGFTTAATTSRGFVTPADVNEAGMENVARPNISITRDYSPRPLISPVQSNSTTTNATEQAYQSTSSTNGTPVVISGGVSGMSVTALQQQPMQIYVDPASKQHYMAIETDQGMQLYPIQIQTDGPVAYSFAPDITSAMATNGGANQTFIMMATGEVEEGSSETLCTMPTARVQTSPSRSNISTRSQKNNELNSRQPQRNVSAHTTTYVALAGQETHVQTRSSQKREGAGGKGNKEKVLSTKRPRHS